MNNNDRREENKFPFLDWIRQVNDGYSDKVTCSELQADAIINTIMERRFVTRFIGFDF